MSDIEIDRFDSIIQRPNIISVLARTQQPFLLTLLWETFKKKSLTYPVRVSNHLSYAFINLFRGDWKVSLLSTLTFIWKRWHKSLSLTDCVHEDLYTYYQPQKRALAETAWQPMLFVCCVEVQFTSWHVWLIYDNYIYPEVVIDTTHDASAHTCQYKLSGADSKIFCRGELCLII